MRLPILAAAFALVSGPAFSQASAPLSPEMQQRIMDAQARYAEVEGRRQADANSDEGLIKHAEQVVAENEKDPDSVKFSGLFVKDGVVCGWVNGKNSYGGYTGKEKFYVRPNIPSHGLAKFFDKTHTDAPYIFYVFSDASSYSSGTKDPEITTYCGDF